MDLRFQAPLGTNHFVSMSEKKILPRCPIRTTLELVGGKWKLLILKELQAGATRPSTLKRNIPEISEKALWRELEQLVASGLVEKKSLTEPEKRTYYSLTTVGKETEDLLLAMVRFAQAYEAKL